MKTEWKTYLETIGIQGGFLKRVQKVLDFYQQVYPKQVEDVFVTEYFDKEGNRQYQNVWLFSSESVMEAKQFLTGDDFDSAPLRRQVRYWNIKKIKYNFRKASTESRMLLDFRLATGDRCELKASRENCDFLKDIFLKHVLPNAIKCPADAQQMDAGDGK